MGRGILLWLVGIPIPVIILLYCYTSSKDQRTRPYGLSD
jgi:hypothetical protein